MLPYRPAAILTDPRSRMGQTPLDPTGNEEVYFWMASQGAALAYAATASFLYGKGGKVLDRILLGVGALAFGLASFSSFMMLDQGPRWHPINGIVGTTMGVMNGIITLGAAGATIKKELPATAQQAVSAALPI